MPHSKLPQLGADGRIVEGIVTTVDSEGVVNVSPMGPIVDEQFGTFVLRPFQTSTTFRLIAHTAVGAPSPLPLLDEADKVAGKVIADACRWYEFQIESIDDREERAVLVGRSVCEGRNRDFLGFNRAQHAVLEAEILDTRVAILPRD